MLYSILVGEPSQPKKGKRALLGDLAMSQLTQLLVSLESPAKVEKTPNHKRALGLLATWRRFCVSPSERGIFASQVATLIVSARGCDVPWSKLGAEQGTKKKQMAHVKKVYGEKTKQKRIIHPRWFPSGGNQRDMGYAVGRI